VIGVPGASSAASDELTSEIAAAAELSCPGVDVRVGYLAGNVQRLEDALTFPVSNLEQPTPLAVIVPLLVGPHPDFDAALVRAVSQTSAPVMLASHLGPHPLLAEALHARLAEAGLAREGRATGLSIASSTNGVLVLADRGEEAVQAAGVTAVLLAARIAVPIVPASLGYPGSVDSALTRLREAGVSRLAISPCVIGPETPPHDIEIISAELGAPCAQPLAAHLAVAQLVAIRYGAALASLTMVGLRGLA
jgi:methylmalonyl-CoA mutase cobalamin-binding subunit